MLKAVIFDMDGVLLDSEPLHMEAINLMLEKLGIKNNRSLKDKLVGADYETLWKTLIRENDLTYPIEELLQLQCHCSYEYFNSADMKEMQGLSQFIADLKRHGIYIAVGSSSPVSLIELVLEKLNLTELIDVFCGIEYVRRPKPAPDIFLWIAKKLEVNSNECLVIEDSLIGITAAKRAEMNCIALCSPQASARIVEKADEVFGQFSELNYEQVKSFVEVK